MSPIAVARETLPELNLWQKALATIGCEVFVCHWYNPPSTPKLLVAASA